MKNSTELKKKKNGFRRIADILHDEKGEGHLVAVVVVAVIVIGLAALFNTQITSFMENMFDKFRNASSGF